ncbi:MAG: diguanylate cyclase [Bacteroidales bacterium]|nr:diguanylate cyclase [Clostridium sp.]MCM1203191.1 diguanylate cyclase [Bacteroidales bacterium]
MKRETSIRGKLLTIGVFPILLLGLLIFSLGITLIYGFAANSVRNEVETATYLLKACLDLSVRGDYVYEDGMLMKGNINVTDSTMLYNIKENSEIDTTIFWGDTRILTTIEDEYGVSAVKSRADEEVINKVLKQGNNYFSRKLKISGMDYIGYYTPLKNNGEDIVGMVFAGKQAAAVYKQIGIIMVWFLLFSLLSILLAMIVSRRFSRQMIVDIDLLKGYLHDISAGDLTTVMDERIKNRRDEISEIGVYAEKMCEALRSLIERDSLTALYNRRTGNNKICTLIKEKKQFSFVMCDIDWFKKVNDQYGHECGDYILIHISEMLRESIKGCGFASRWGGEEFLLVYELDFEQVRQKVEALLKRVRNTEFCYKDNVLHITMTFGIKEMEPGASYESMIKEADDNLYKGKNAGRNQIVY